MDDKKKIELAYDNAAKDYDFAMCSRMTHAAWLFRDLKIPKKPTVLDVGCGTGASTFELMKGTHWKGKFFGVDLSQKMVDAAKKKAVESHRDNVEFSRGDAEHLDFPDSSFDLVISNQVFHWIQNKRKALREIFRLLKPSGQVALWFQGGPSFKELFEAYERVKRRHPDYDFLEMPRRLTLQETQNLLVKAGFQEVRVFALHEISYIGLSLFWNNEDLTTSPWKIGLSYEVAERVQKEVARELLRKPQDSLRTTIYTIFGHGKKPPS